MRRVAEKLESFAGLHLTEALFQLWLFAFSMLGVGVAVGHTRWQPGTCLTFAWLLWFVHVPC